MPPEEKVLYQVVCCDTEGVLTRPCQPHEDREKAEQDAQDQLKHPMIQETFVCTVHAAFKKVYGVKRTL